MIEPGLNKDLIIADLGARNAEMEALLQSSIASLQIIASTFSISSANIVRNSVGTVVARMEAGYLDIMMNAAARADGVRQEDSAQVLPFGAPAADEQVPA